MKVETKIQEELAKLNVEEQSSVLDNFQNFKQYLAGKIELGENLGLSEEKLAKTTEYIANYLAKHEQPRNREEHMLMELWKAGNKEEQHALAHLLLKMVRNA